MRQAVSGSVRLSIAVGVLPLLVSSLACQRDSATPSEAAPVAPARSRTPIVNVPGTPIQLTARRMTTALRDGTPTPMWGYCVTGQCTGAWAPGPTIVATAGTTLDITLTNTLPVPTSLVVLGQLGGGLGAPATMASPAHAGQNNTTFPGNAPVNVPSPPPAFQPPPQADRVRSFGAEVPASTGVATLSWTNLRPGTYLYETGTMPSLQVPMGLYGVLVVTTPPAAGDGGFVPGAAYPNVSYDDEVSLLFSEMDPVQNAAVDAAADAGTGVNLRFNDPSCTPAAPCYPAAVNYTPTYFFINGRFFDATAPESSAYLLGDTAPYTTGNVLVRLLNAGSRTYVPTVVGLPMALVAEDGNPTPGKPKVQNEVLLTAGKTHDVVVRPAVALDGGVYAPGTFPVFDRSLNLSTANKPLGGMQAYLLIHHAAAQTQLSLTHLPGPAAVPVPGAPGNLPAAVVPKANPDVFLVPYDTVTTGNVTTNDIGITRVTLGTPPSHGSLALKADGTFTFTPTTGYTGVDQFTYLGNGLAALQAAVTLNIGATGVGPAPIAVNDSYTSAVSGKLSLPRPGVLANDHDPSGYPLTAGAVTASTCTSVTLNANGSLEVAGALPSCQFSYTAINSQGTGSAPATVVVTFGAPSNLSVTVVDAQTNVPITDYRWTLQEDLTFKHATSGTPPVTTRTIGTSFHRSHMPVVATGCVGPVSCGSGQSVLNPATSTRVTLTDAQALLRQTLPSQVVLDPTRRYFLSILTGDAGSPPGHIMGGAEVTRALGGGWAPVLLRLQPSPLVPAQLSIYLYEDNAPTNGQNEPGEHPLGGFNIVLFDPAGRTGDPAGQQTYDASNMPLSNALLGRPGCPDEQNAQTNGTASSPGGNLVGVIYTCPNDPNEGTPAADPLKYSLAGHALIKNLTPARYDVIAHPGAARDAAGEVWWETETLEGTPAQDAFTGINEPTYFQEFGPPGPHTTIGFVNPAHVAAYAAAQALVGTHTITGRVTNQHMSRPSNVTLWDSSSYDLLSATTCRVALNSQAGLGPTIATAQCDQDGNFTLTGIPPGDYQVSIFDQWLDQIIQAVAVRVPATTTMTTPMGNLPVLSWFTQYDQNIFQDLNKNGVYDDGEPGISNVPLTVRFRNGSLSNRTLTDSSGNGVLPELFPLFNWYVAESDTTRFKQTGVHIIVDGGGRPDATGLGAGLWTSHYATGESSDRVEQPGAPAYGLQGFVSQRNRVDWGRTPYAPSENGGIVGSVVYSSTRPFDDMRLDVQTIWEPLVPRVTVNLYRKEILADGTETLTKWDTTTTTSWDDYVNLVKGADNQPYLLGTDGVLRDPTTGAQAPDAGYPAGVQVNLQCPGQLATDPFVAYTLGAGDRQRCYDGFHDWNQVQAAPYDGRYAFPSAAYAAAHPLTAAQKAAGQTLVSLPPGTYVVEAVTPPGYEVVKEEDKNILIGDAFVAPAAQQFGALSNVFILPDQATLNNANPNNPTTGDPGFQSDPTSNLGVSEDTRAAFFPRCVGALHRVPDFLSLYPQAHLVAPFAGMDRPLCDRKQVTLVDQLQTSASFFIYTQVPVAANNTGIILDDASSEFNATAPDFGEKASVPFVPVSIKDFAGLEVSRTYSDQWGAYNMLTVSSWLVNPPTPSGYGPNMMVTCMNDPGPIPDPAGVIDPATGKPRLITDPAYNPAYSNFCYTNPFMPGQTTYLDTPVLPVAAFAAGYNPVDCALPAASPVIKRVDSSAGFGPWLPSTGGTLTITAAGDQTVQNPAYEGPFATSGPTSQPTITRHYGFGDAPGQVLIGDVDLSDLATWSDGSITVTVPDGTPTGELVVVTAAGQASIDAVTVTLGGGAPTRVTSGGSIQAAIDAAAPGTLILIDAGTYNELVIMWKPVRLQGVGAGSVIINAAKFPTSKLENWRPRINALFSIDPVTGTQTGIAQVDPLPTQEITGPAVVLEPSVLGAEEGAGITVLAKNLLNAQCSGGALSTFGQPITQSNFWCEASRIDGLSITGGDTGGGIFVNGWAHGLEISNNRLYNNAGAFHGGVRVGVPGLELESLPTNGSGEVELADDERIAGFGFDVGVTIHHNSITKNGTVEGVTARGGAGAGISICAGTDGYSVDHNFVCGNFSSADGAGIGHLGFSQGGLIAFNQVLFNQSFQQTTATHGGGIAVVGEPPIAGAVGLGTGDLVIDANLIRGNFAEGGQGGGIRLEQVNGADVTAFPQPGRWHQVTLTNNMIADNVAGWAGGGISMADTLRAFIVNNTIASNDSVGIAGVALVAGVGRPAPAGIVSEPTSAQLLAQLPTAALRTANAISRPVELLDNIVWKNRSFYYSGNNQLCAGNTVAAAGGPCAVLPDQTATGQCVAGARYWDLGVLGDGSPAPGAQRLNPRYSVLTSTAGYSGANNSSADPLLADEYCNGSRPVPELPLVLNPPGVKNFQVAATVDEGNNYVNLRYGPLYVVNPVTLLGFGDYHLRNASSPAVDTGLSVGAVTPDHDFDNQTRPSGRAIDRGAHEVQQ